MPPGAHILELGAGAGRVTHPPFVSAVAVHEVDGETSRQPFTARVLSMAEISDELGRVGLRLRRQLSNNWMEAVGWAG